MFYAMSQFLNSCSECGHGKCFECMFNSSERCNICLGVENAISPIHAGSGPGGNRIFASVHGRVRAPASGRTRPGPVALKTASAFSRESGFQSATASLCSGNGFPPSSAGKYSSKWNVLHSSLVRISGLSFGHFSVNHRLVDLPEYWVFWIFSLEFWENHWVFVQLMGKYW